MALILSSILILVFISPSWTASDVAGPAPSHRDVEVHLIVKSPILEGSDLELECRFDVSRGTAVSSVKWYKGIREIFRYEHKPVPKKQVLPFGNLTIDDTLSSMQVLYLKRVPAFMSGKISCEVTLEDPSAKAVTRSTKLLVVVPPTEGPSLEASLIQFSHSNIVHQKLIANCTSAPSKPAANLTIYINDSPHFVMASKGERIRSLPDILVNNNLLVRRIELELDLTPKHFVNGKIWTKCASTLFDLHRNVSDEYVLEQAVAASKRHNSLFVGSRLRSQGAALCSCCRMFVFILLMFLAPHCCHSF